MYVGKDFDTQDPGESEVFSFDFSNLLADAEIIQSVDWELETIFGSDDYVSGRLSGLGSIAAGIVSHRIENLEAGVIYRVQAVASTDQDNVISLYSHIACKGLD